MPLPTLRSGIAKIDVAVGDLGAPVAAGDAHPVVVLEPDLLGRILEARRHEQRPEILEHRVLRDPSRAVRRTHRRERGQREHESSTSSGERRDRRPVGHAEKLIVGLRVRVDPRRLHEHRGPALGGHDAVVFLPVVVRPARGGEDRRATTVGVARRRRRATGRRARSTRPGPRPRPTAIRISRPACSGAGASGSPACGYRPRRRVRRRVRRRRDGRGPRR